MPNLRSRGREGQGFSLLRGLHSARALPILPLSPSLDPQRLPERCVQFPLRCIIDGEAVACGDDGIASFDRIRYRRHDAGVFLYAFDLIELDGDDLRRDPLAVRKATLASLLRRAAPGLRFNEHLDNEDGPLVFAHACKMGLEGIVSKRKDSH
jgi:bifunctional non-homologous end joining protein LigD